MPIIVIPLAIDIVSIAALWTSGLTLALKIVFTAAIIIKYVVQFIGMFTAEPPLENILCVLAIAISAATTLTMAIMGEWYVFAPCLMGTLLFAGWWIISTFHPFLSSDSNKDQ